MFPLPYHEIVIGKDVQIPNKMKEKPHEPKSGQLMFCCKLRQGSLAFLLSSEEEVCSSGHTKSITNIEKYFCRRMMKINLREGDLPTCFENTAF